MSFLKSFWPTPFKIQKGNVGSFIVQLIIFVVICAIIGWLFGILGGIPILGLIFKILGSLIELYSFIGIVLCILKFIGIV